MDLGLLKDKYRFYFTHLTGGAENWVGNPIISAHKHVKVDDRVFDSFNSHCIQTIKEMKSLKVDGLKEMIRLLQALRDSIVAKEGAAAEEVVPVVAETKTLFQEMGGMEAIKDFVN